MYFLGQVVVLVYKETLNLSPPTSTIEHRQNTIFWNFPDGSRYR